ncbi:tripartite tricarboxylate transporter substrate binding protein [Pigmentiphaga sp. H8]|uniref:Bug family tripartite tricarboxylate transporter substrate binding protein n=1 Tax=Pigmentiphaga sp. H8 TaxID=2488560 RepID=UPI000F5ABD37|nr:tripartite tricarboxylate transporter substrate binding protein [Pigmentiphaga sp. H8]AZG09757.1 tripartite tricarboxylate transporter substrate binding protein [Pigmentiphaga sp. H8]
MSDLVIDRRRLLLALAGTALARPSFAADFPVEGRPISLTVGYPAGGGTDMQARLLARFLSPSLGVPVVVVNRPGAGTILAATEVARAVPDGHTLMYTPSSTIAQLPHTVRAARYDAFRDFTPVAQCALGPTVLVLHNSIPATNTRELAAYGKAHPGQLNYVSQGMGTAAHIFGQMLARQLQIDMVHVPYKGANDVAKDFITGRVHLQFASSSGAVALAKTGKVRLLGVVALKRSALFPDLPTMAEMGVQGMDIGTELGLIGPAGMAPSTVARLAEATRGVMALPNVREDFVNSGVEVQWLNAADFARDIRETDGRWKTMLAAIDFKME